MNEQNQQFDKDSKVKVMVVDDHPVMRQGLRQLINHEPDLEVCAEACSGSEALEAFGKQHIDLAVVDISMPGTTGIQLTEKIKSQYPEVRVLILSMHDEPTFCQRAFRAGARGYVAKEEPPENIITAIRRVMSGKIHIPQKEWQHN